MSVGFELLFCRLGGKIVGWKNCRLENFPCQNGNGNVRTFPGMQDQKTGKQQATSNTLAPKGPFWSAEQKGSQNRRKKVTTLSGGCFAASFSGTTFFWSDPQVVAKGDLLGVWPVLGRQHLENFRAQVKNRKTRFPGARGTFGGKSVRPKSFSPKLRNLFTCCVFADRTPRGGKSPNTGFVPSGRPPQ